VLNIEPMHALVARGRAALEPDTAEPTQLIGIILVIN